jgi:mono/diheme cytochrome c family protein
MKRIRVTLFVNQDDAETIRHRLCRSGVGAECRDKPPLTGFCRRKLLGIVMLFGGVLLLLENHSSLAAGVENAASAQTETVPAAARDRLNIVQISVGKQASANSEAPTYFRDVLPIIMGKCARCHDPQSKVLQNWLDYNAASAHRWEIKRRVWDSWKGAYFKQPMPTANSPETGAMTDDERAIIKNWVERGALRGVARTYASLSSKGERIEFGKRLFSTLCATCHQPTGQGIPGRFPPLAGSDFLNSDKHRAIKIVVNGLQGEITVRGQKFNNSMPKFPLSDQEIAGALTFVYNSFGNSGKDVTPEEVSAVRAEKEEPSARYPKAPQEKSPFE